MLHAFVCESPVLLECPGVIEQLREDAKARRVVVACEPPQDSVVRTLGGWLRTPITTVRPPDAKGGNCLQGKTLLVAFDAGVVASLVPYASIVTEVNHFQNRRNAMTFSESYSLDRCDDHFNRKWYMTITSIRRNLEEIQYAQMLHDCLHSGYRLTGRTGVPTRSVIGRHTTWSIRDYRVPLMLHKPMPWKRVVAELLWFVKGRTDLQWLHKHDVHFWDANLAVEQRDKRGLGHLPAGDLGKGYGFQFRHFGGEQVYSVADGRMIGRGGVDQLARVEELLANDPTSNYILVNLWNAKDIREMLLPPCLFSYQWLVDEWGGVTCVVNQRSVDCVLGLPFNIASAAILTMMLVHCSKNAKLWPKEIVHFGHNVHVYETHTEATEAAITRIQGDLKPACECTTPRLVLGRKPEHVWDLELSDFDVRGYHPDPNPLPKAPIAV